MIHKIRFEHFSYDIVCPETVDNQPIPKLFLLPLVENAIKYGMQYRIDLHIDIQITLDEFHSLLTVTGSSYDLDT